MSNCQNSINGILKNYSYNGCNTAPLFIVYSESITNRLNYTLRFVFNQILLTGYLITNDEKVFVESELIKINYSNKSFSNTITIFPSGLLSESGVKEFVPTCTTSNNKVLLFTNTKSDLGFDLFSAVFYLISRMEEWQKFVKDEHGRFEVRNSILYKLSVLKQPLVDCWINDFRKIVIEKFPEIKLSSRSFQYISTIDVDNAFAFKGKSLFRNLGGGVKDLLAGNVKMALARIGTLISGKKDPFDAYDIQIDLSDKYLVPLIYFFLYRTGTEFDRTLDPKNFQFNKLINGIKNKGIAFGLHPSYYSSEDGQLLLHEKKLLETNSGSIVEASRQHYLRFNIKTTPKQLLNAGIKYDFTMGFANSTGFRAGTSMPFYYYDFEEEKELEIMAVPFAAMDGAYYIYDNTNVKEALDEMISVANQVKQVNGLMITVFHERTFAKELYPGWSNIYTKLHQSLGAS